MEIFAANYTLTPIRSLNSRAASAERPGALLKVVADDGAVGYADLHPWEVLGDLPLAGQLKWLSEGRTTSLSSRSLELAGLDREARRKRASAFSGLRIPKSHYLVTDLLSSSEDEIRVAVASGFEAIKVKVGRDPAAEILALEKWSGLFASGLKLRLDFNGVMTESGYEGFIGALSSTVARAIEFVEDPVPWSTSTWKYLARLAAPLALDRISEEELGAMEKSRESPFQWLIVKPAIQDPVRMVRLAGALGKRVAVTSYMDHPVGQMGAALEAGRLGAGAGAGTGTGSSTSFGDGGGFEFIGHCGLASHLAFERNEFSERLSVQNAVLVVPDGMGIGFDDLLEAQDWKRIL